MKVKRILYVALSLILLCSLVLPLAIYYAEEANNSGMKLNKTAVANGDGTYTISLEAYATGEKIISSVTKDVPTDIILVLDQSGSMADDIGSVYFEDYSNKSNSFLYGKRHNGGDGNLWHKLADGSFVSVSVTKSVEYEVMSTDSTNDDYYDERTLYEKVGDEYKKVTVTREWVGIIIGYFSYTYTFSDGTTVVSDRRNTKPNLGSHTPLYVAKADGANTVYTYVYTDDAGETQTIGTSTGVSSDFDTTLYQRRTRSSGGGSRLSALTTAVKNFTNAVRDKAEESNIDHRIAVVGFAGGYDSAYGAYTNTEVFVGKNQYTYGSSARAQYENALQKMNTKSGYDNVIASIGALEAKGGTHVQLGIEMANGILEKNPIPENETRNRVVIVFTDGVPSGTGSSYSSSVASAAITNANATKSTYGATVYTIGIFSGADATNAGNQYGSETERANWFMHTVSSNNGTVRNPSYYLSAGDAGSLNNIFEQISANIEYGGANTKLDEESVIRDIISPQFALPEGATAADITLETYACTGKSGSEYTWSKNTELLGATAVVSGDTVSVTGFDFSENYVGSVTSGDDVTYRGNKLVISFTVVPKEGFLGGNNVYTNTSAGVYENANAAEPVAVFNRPTVNVPIADVTVTAADKNVYLLGNVTGAQLRDGITAACGSVSLDLDAVNYGLESWQTEYVNITSSITDKSGDDVTDFSKLTDDETYTVAVEVSPKTSASSESSGTPATAKSNNATGNINVFKPEVNYKDSTAYYGGTAPTGFDTNNKLSETWKHGTTLDSAVTMTGTKPSLRMSYTPESGKIADGKVNTKKDFAVDAKAYIGSDDVTSYTTFKHTKCGSSCTDPANGKFWIHVKTCSLTITKQGGDANESYVFTVYKNGASYTELSVWGNSSVTIYELPVGVYTIEEDAGWSWRYEADDDDEVELTETAPNDEIVCVNTKTNDKWLNGFSAVVKNTFEKAQ